MNLPPIDLTGEILQLPVTPRPAVNSESFLVPVPFSKCSHFRGPFEVDSKSGKCRCKECGDEVSAMFVLEKLMAEESRWMRTRAAYQDEMRRLNERSRTKCRHCGEMTEISRK